MPGDVRYTSLNLISKYGIIRNFTYERWNYRVKLRSNLSLNVLTLGYVGAKATNDVTPKPANSNSRLQVGFAWIEFIVRRGRRWFLLGLWLGLWLGFHPIRSGVGWGSDLPLSPSVTLSLVHLMEQYHGKADAKQLEICQHDYIFTNYSLTLRWTVAETIKPRTETPFGVCISKTCQYSLRAEKRDIHFFRDRRNCNLKRTEDVFVF